MSTREIAICVWAGVLLLYVFFNKEARNVKSGIISSGLKVILNSISLTFFLPNIVLIYLFYLYVGHNGIEISYWYIKDYFLIIISLFPFILKNYRYSMLDLLKKKFLNLMILFVLPTFLTSNYTFSIWVELLIVPILGIVYLFLGFSESDIKYKMVTIILQSIVTIITITIFINSVGLFFKNINDIKTFQFWLSFGIEYVVWLVNIPFLIIVRHMLEVENHIITIEKKIKVYYFFLFDLKLLKHKLSLKKQKESSVLFEQDKFDFSVKRGVLGLPIIKIRSKSNFVSKYEYSLLMNFAITGKLVDRQKNAADFNSKYPIYVELTTNDSSQKIVFKDYFIEDSELFYFGSMTANSENTVKFE